MSANMNSEISPLELTALTELAGRGSITRISADFPVEPAEAPEAPPYDMDEAARAKWWAEQEEKQAKRAEELAKRNEEMNRRMKEARAEFKRMLDERIAAAFAAGAESAVSTEARRAITVRGYVLLGVVAAVVAMPLIAMLLELDPQTFGAFIAPVTGITGTIVGYWFGTAGQGMIQPQGQKQSLDLSDRR